MHIMESPDWIPWHPWETHVAPLANPWGTPGKLLGHSWTLPGYPQAAKYCYAKFFVI